MTVLSIGEARNRLADAVNRVSYGGERIVFARRGKPVAALVSADDLDTLQRVEDMEDSRSALKEYARNKSGAATPAEHKIRRNIMELAGCLKYSKALRGDPVSIQKGLRNEW